MIPPNDHLRHGSQDQPLSLLTQSFHSMDRYCIATVKPVNQALENKDTCIIHTLSYSHKWCLSIQIDPDNQDTLIIRKLMNGLKVSIIHRHHCTGLSNIMDT